MTIRTVLFLLVWTLAGVVVRADSTSPWQPYYFSDVYYMYDFQHKSADERPYSVSSNQQHTFALNLGVLGVKYKVDGLRADVSVHAGSYVDDNYVTERTVLKWFHNAMAGVRIADGLWVDAGIMPSHIGYESAISSENLNYTRSLMAEFSPYYQIGVKATWDVLPELQVAVLGLNGWQNITDLNSSKALGTQIVWRPNPTWKFNWSSYLGDESPDFSASTLMLYNDVYAEYKTTDLTVAAVFDIGFIDTRQNARVWYAGTVQGRLALSSLVAVNARVECFLDDDRTIVGTPLSRPFNVVGGSVGVDVAPHPNGTLRFEGRYLHADADVFRGGLNDSKRDIFLTAALVVSIP